MGFRYIRAASHVHLDRGSPVPQWSTNISRHLRGPDVQGFKAIPTLSSANVGTTIGQLSSPLLYRFPSTRAPIGLATGGSSDGIKPH